MIWRSIILVIAALVTTTSLAAQRTFSVSGRVISSSTREAIAYASVTIDGQPQRGAVTSTSGEFTIEGVEPGLFRVIAQAFGYELSYSDDVMVSARTQPVEIDMALSAREIDSVVVRPSPFKRAVESPVSMYRVSAQQIEKSPGANRDVSRIVQSYPGVAFSPAGYRNDLIVRGGSPSENKFYVDDIEIPNINHFSTQGASGGPVSILNADLIREIELYSGAFPIQYTGALSSVMDVKLRDGDTQRQNFKVTLGASELSLSGSGHVGDKTTYLFSVRQSYLQLLFKALGLPFLPNFIDGQLKVKHRFDRNNELTVLALMGIDRMEFNESADSESAEYILGYLPRVEQQTLTVGMRYRHFVGESSYALIASHSYLDNLNEKYEDNDDSDPSKLKYELRSREQKTTLRSENRSPAGDNVTLRYGAQLDYWHYDINSFSRELSGGVSDYTSELGVLCWGGHIGAGYRSDGERFTASLGVGMDGNDFNSSTLQLWRHLSPRLSLSYALDHGLAVSGSTGIYYSMASATSLSYRDSDGVAVNGDLGYMRVKHLTLGLSWRAKEELFASIEGFYKYYNDMPMVELTSQDGQSYYIPLADSGTDYGTIGDDKLIQSGVGRAYGVELMGQMQRLGRLSLVGSLTFYRSEYAVDSHSAYNATAWDNRVILNTSGTYFMRKGWSIGGKLSAIGGAPYTPYDEDVTSLKSYWDLVSQPYYDYSQYNGYRLRGYCQFDLRIDKSFYYSSWTLGLYLDLQNLFVAQYWQPDIPISSGESDPNDPSRYILTYLGNSSGTLLPTFGITAQF